ncbi:MAG: hypothetical protein ABI444_08120 [Candidatus Kapaibacterium sp.]|jgi:hypothetical protein
MKRYLTLLPLFLVLIFTESPVHAQSEPQRLFPNSIVDYAPAFRTNARGTELWWVTSLAPNDSSRSRRLVKATWTDEGIGAMDALPFPINQQIASDQPVLLDGCPTFSYCDAATCIFSSNRPVEGKSYDNDLYEVRRENSEWHLNRIDALSSQGWDDTPTLTADGNTIFFASDRLGIGNGVTQIFTAHRTGSSWSVPSMLVGLTSDAKRFSTQTPCVGVDGYLYYSTNDTKDGDYDIWKIKLDPTSKLPIGNASPLDMAGVNEPGSDEGHPTFSPGGEWMLFSSARNSGSTPRLHIYSIHLPQSKTTDIHIKVLERTHIFSDSAKRFFDVVLPVSTTLFFTNPSGTEEQIVSDARGDAMIHFPRPTATPGADSRLRKTILYAKSNKQGVISSIDTLLFDVTCPSLTHTLYLWDSSIYYSPECTMDFRVRDIPFFIQGYWCPTTQKYKTCATCASVFPDSGCTEVALEPPPLPCKPEDDLRVYKVHYVAPSIEVSSPIGLCINRKEWRDSSLAYGHRVDSVIELYIEEMKLVFSNETRCIERAIARGETITIDIVGWTDPLGIDNSCRYTGADINFNNSFIQLQEMEQKHGYIENGVLKKGTPFSRSGMQGNQMLSDLRAYFTAMLLDSLWTANIDQYRELRAIPGRLKLTAVGKGISKKDHIPLSEQRSVDVIVTAPVDKRDIYRPDMPPPGSTVTLCAPPCATAAAMER